MAVNLDSLCDVDQAELFIVPPGHHEAIGSITFAGPIHPATVEAEREYARVKPEAKRLCLPVYIFGRVLAIDGITVVDDGEPDPRPMDAEDLFHALTQPRFGWLFHLCERFLADPNSFAPNFGDL